MRVKPKKQFKPLIKFLDAINPILIILSIIGLFLEYTGYKTYVLTPNKVISVLFVLDFLLRLLCFRPGEYFTKGYGWVDFIASLPGFFFFLNNTPLLTVFKIVKVGRFFKIIRILRFLRVFNFLKRMKADSVWIQDRIMKIGITVVFVSVIGIIFIDNKVSNSLIEQESIGIKSLYNASKTDLNTFSATNNKVLYYLENKKLYSKDGNLLNNFSEISNLISSEVESFYTISLTNNYFSTESISNLPETGFIVSTRDIEKDQYQVMIMMLSTLLLILVVIIFYMGSVFARDMQIVQLIVDSFDAEDNLLLKQEADKYRDEDGNLVVDGDDSEIINLLKASANIYSDNTIQNDDVMGSFGNLFNDDQGSVNSSVTSDNSDLDRKLFDLEDRIVSNNNYLVEDTVKRLTPAIIKYIKKELKD